jgi:predicted transglutaminase-like cysteine proteinase
MRLPDQCRFAPGTPDRIVLDPERRSAIEAVNRQVNKDISPLDDKLHYDRAEYWTIPTDGYGDCEDYALTKRQRLIAAGFPARALRVALVQVSPSVRHAVLTVVTDRGDLVLDNLVPEIRAPLATGYTWVMRQDPNDPHGWVDYPLPAPDADPVLVASAGTPQKSAAEHTYAEPVTSIAAAIPKRTLGAGTRRLRKQPWLAKQRAPRSRTLPFSPSGTCASDFSACNLGWGSRTLMSAASSRPWVPASIKFPPFGLPPR